MSHFVISFIFLLISVSSYKSYFFQIPNHSNKRNLKSFPINTRKLSNEIYCSKINSCFLCNGNNANQFPCIWQDGICRMDQNNFYNNSHWVIQLSQCTDQNSFNIMEKYCGTLIENTNGDTVTLQNANLYGETSISNLFCKWEYLHNKNSSFVIKLKMISECKLSLTKKDTLTNSIQEIYFEDSLSEKYDYDDSLYTLYYYSERRQNSKPFEISIESYQTFHISKIILYLVASVGAIVFLLTIIVLIFCFVKALSKSSSPVQENISNPSSSSNVSTPRKCLVTIKEFNIKQVIMDKKIKLFNKKCPVCINELEEGDEIIITLCEHGFHSKCIEEWIMKAPTKNNFCPLCNLNFKISKKDGHKKESI